MTVVDEHAQGAATGRTICDLEVEAALARAWQNRETRRLVSKALRLTDATGARGLLRTVS